jgi:hypothetical protein
LSGPSVSGTTLLDGYNPLAISYDPVTQTVQGSVDGVLTPALSYTATGITSAGFEGSWTVNNFIVQTGAIVPEPSPLPALFGLVATAVLLRRSRKQQPKACAVREEEGRPPRDRFPVSGRS